MRLDEGVGYYVMEPVERAVELAKKVTDMASVGVRAVREKLSYVNKMARLTITNMAILVQRQDLKRTKTE